MKTTLLSLAFLSLTSLAFAQKKTNYKTVPALVKEAQEKGNKQLADSLAQDYINKYLFKLKEQEFFSKDNLTFMSQHLNGTESKAFKLFLKYPEKVNAVLGNDAAEYALRYAISNDYFKDIDPEKKPGFDWSGLKNTVKSKFGEMGLEALYGKQMRYYKNAGDWENFGKYYVLYFEKALKRPEFFINDVNWMLFENVNDPEVLRFACDVVMKYAMETWYQNDLYAYDTYANLLYKTGKKDEAIEWEERAAKRSNQEKVYVETLEKMRRGIKTWPETVVKQ